MRWRGRSSSRSSPACLSCARSLGLGLVSDDDLEQSSPAPTRPRTRTEIHAPVDLLGSAADRALQPPGSPADRHDDRRDGRHVAVVDPRDRTSPRSCSFHLRRPVRLVRAAVRLMREALLNYASSSPPVEPSPGMRRRRPPRVHPCLGDRRRRLASASEPVTARAPSPRCPRTPSGRRGPAPRRRGPHLRRADPAPSRPPRRPAPPPRSRPPAQHAPRAHRGATHRKPSSSPARPSRDPARTASHRRGNPRRTRVPARPLPADALPATSPDRWPCTPPIPASILGSAPRGADRDEILDLVENSARSVARASRCP